MEKITVMAAQGANMIDIAGVSVNLFGVVIFAFFAFIAILFWKSHKSKSLDFTDMITRDGRKVSTTKILQLLGGVVGTWIIVKVTLQGNLNWDLYMIYLAYVAGVDGFSKLVTAKYTSGSSSSSSGYGRNYGGNSYSNNDLSDDEGLPQPRSTRRNNRSTQQTDFEEGDHLSAGGAKAG